MISWTFAKDFMGLGMLLLGGYAWVVIGALL